MPTNDYDITGNIKAIEKLKLELLQSVVSLLKNMSNQRSEHEERLVLLTDAIIHTYMLAARLGVDFTELDEAAVNRIKIEVLKEDGVLAADYAALLRHIRGHKI